MEVRMFHKLEPRSKLPAAKTTHPREEYGQPDVHNPTVGLEGYPGHRTQPGRTGYDPLESVSEMSHVLGVLINRFITLRLHTRNWFYLALMAFLGVLCMLPAIYCLGLFIASDGQPYELLVISVVAGLLGILWTSNLLMNLWYMRRTPPR
jgi:hypothetical protein